MKKTTRPIEILSRAEISALMKTCTRCPSGMRDKALIALLFGAGLRLGEALALLPRDMDMDAGTINIRHGKGDRQRIVGIDDGNLALVQQWMTCRKARGARRSARSRGYNPWMSAVTRVTGSLEGLRAKGAWLQFCPDLTVQP